MKRAGLLCATALVLASCSGEISGGKIDAGAGGVDAGPGGESGSIVALGAKQRLTRASMALRGRRPSAAEYRRVSETPEDFSALSRSYLEDMGPALRDMWNEALLMRLEQVFLAPVGILSGETPAELSASRAEMPLRLIEHVVQNDRPFTEILTADYAVADGIVADAYGLSRPAPAGRDAWVVSQWPAGHPAAGILADPGMSARYPQVGGNFNRLRASGLAAALWCDDYAARGASFSGNFNSGSGPEDAVSSSPSCIECHQSLDATASFLWGLRDIHPASAELLLAPSPADGGQRPYDPYPLWIYNRSLEERWQITSGREPSFYGATTPDAPTTLEQLARLIAEDRRFAECTARRFYSYFFNTDVARVPRESAEHFTEVLISSGYSAKELAHAIVTSEEFAHSHAEGETPADPQGFIRARPAQLARAIEDLTGFRWTFTVAEQQALFGEPIRHGYTYVYDANGNPADSGGTPTVERTFYGDIDLLTSFKFGYEVLAGGINILDKVRPARSMAPAGSLVTRELAARAAAHAVRRELEQGMSPSRPLFSGVDSATIDESTIRQKLSELHLRVLGVVEASDSLAVDDTYTLWANARQRGLDAGASDPVSTRYAWAVALTALLQSPEFLYF